MNRLVVSFFIVTICLYFAETQETTNEATFQTYDDLTVNDGGAGSENERAMGNAQSIAHSAATTGGTGEGSKQPSPIFHTYTECYACTDCAKVLPNTATKQCPSSNDPVKQKSCVVYVEKYKYMPNPWVVRGCATERGSCVEIKKMHENSDLVRLVSCKQCEGDKCNSGVSFSMPNIIFSFTILILTPLLKTYTFL